jgi:hypothetical protein
MTLSKQQADRRCGVRYRFELVPYKGKRISAILVEELKTCGWRWTSRKRVVNGVTKNAWRMWIIGTGEEPHIRKVSTLKCAELQRFELK